MEYKGFVATAEFDDEAEVFHGEVLCIRDVVTFQGRSVDELKKAHEDSVDDYLEFCKQRGEEPNKPFSGRLLLRLPPDLREVYVAAKHHRMSLNAWIVEQLENLQPGKL